MLVKYCFAISISNIFEKTKIFSKGVSLIFVITISLASFLQLLEMLGEDYLTVPLMLGYPFIAI